MNLFSLPISALILMPVALEVLHAAASTLLCGLVMEQPRAERESAQSSRTSIEHSNKAALALMRAPTSAPDQAKIGSKSAYYSATQFPHALPMTVALVLLER